MLKLHTFGGLRVTDCEGNTLVEGGSLRRPLALLAIVAAAGPRGVTRDKLVALLWPEANSDRGRHSVTQAMYSVRRMVGIDDLFLTDGAIRLNADRISSDLVDLDRAIAQASYCEVERVYVGRFLDGATLSDVPGLDAWITAQADRLEERVVAALDAAASAAEADGNLARAIELRKRVVRINPIDSRAVSHLLDALTRVGNAALALRLAEEHQSLLQRQVGLAPDQRFAEHVERIRAAQRPSECAIAATTIERGDDRLPRLNFGSMVEPRSSRWPMRLRMTFAAIGAALVIGIGVIRGLWARSPGEGATPAGELLVVTPFNVAGASSRLAYMGVAASELLGQRLGIDSLIRPLDAGAVLSAWRSRSFDRMPAVATDSAITFAMSIGARQVVTGSVVGTRARAVVQATLRSLPDRRTIARATVAGPADSVMMLMHDLAARLLLTEAGESEDAGLTVRASLPALRQYVVGRAAERHGDLTRAARAYVAAVAHDSTFALAALRLTRVADLLGDAELEADAVASAWNARAALDDDDRALLRAYTGPRYPEPSRVDEQQQAWNDAARHNIGRADGWTVLAARLFHDGDRVGTSARDQAGSAVARALAIDSQSVVARVLANELHVRADRESGLDQLWLSDVRARAMSALWSGGDRDVLARALEQLSDESVTADQQVDGVLAQHSLALNEGRAAEALASTQRLHALRPDSHAFLRLRILDALYGEGDSRAAAQAAAELGRAIAKPLDGFPLERRRRTADACILAQWRLARRDTSGVGDIATFLRETDGVSHAPAVSTPAPVCADLLDAAYSVIAHKQDAFVRLRRLDSLSLTSAVAGNAASYSHILIARLFEQLGHPRLALNALRKRSYLLGWPAYLATALREERRLSEMLGDSRSAERAAEAYRALRGS